MVSLFTSDIQNRCDCLIRFSLLFLLFLGCSPEKGQDVPEQADNASCPESCQNSATNSPLIGKTDEPAGQKVELTEEERAIERMNQLVDNRDTAAALVAARGLMDSENAAVRMAVVNALGFIGKPAIMDIEAMLNDADEEVAQDALNAWEMALMEYSSDRVRAAIVERAVKGVGRRAILDAILMQLSGIDEKLALMTLQRIIENNVGKAVSVCAKGMFEHIAGEQWDSAERLVELLKEL